MQYSCFKLSCIGVNLCSCVSFDDLQIQGRSQGEHWAREVIGHSDPCMQDPPTATGNKYQWWDWCFAFVRASTNYQDVEVIAAFFLLGLKQKFKTL